MTERLCGNHVSAWRLKWLNGDRLSAELLCVAKGLEGSTNDDSAHELISSKLLAITGSVGTQWSSCLWRPSRHTKLQFGCPTQEQNTTEPPLHECVCAPLRFCCLLLWLLLSHWYPTCHWQTTFPSIQTIRTCTQKTNIHLCLNFWQNCFRTRSTLACTCKGLAATFLSWACGQSGMIYGNRDVRPTLRTWVSQELNQTLLLCRCAVSSQPLVRLIDLDGSAGLNTWQGCLSKRLQGELIQGEISTCLQYI